MRPGWRIPTQMAPKPSPSESTSIESCSGIRLTTLPVAASTAHSSSGAAPQSSPLSARKGTPSPRSISVVRPVCGSTRSSGVESLDTHRKRPAKTALVWTVLSIRTWIRWVTPPRRGRCA
jgi:hypothetical protein